jgi:hypothetical protein
MAPIAAARAARSAGGAEGSAEPEDPEDPDDTASPWTDTSVAAPWSWSISIVTRMAISYPAS